MREHIYTFLIIHMFHTNKSSHTRRLNKLKTNKFWLFLSHAHCDQNNKKKTIRDLNQKQMHHNVSTN